MQQSNMQHFACELQSAHDPFIWATIGLSASGIPLCAYFLTESWKTWRQMRRPAAARSSQVTLESQPSQGALNTLPSHGKLISSEAYDASPARSVRTVSEASKATTAKSSLRTEPGPFLSPLRWIRQLSFNETLHLLLLTSWVIMTIDQFLDTSYVVAVAFLCPHYNCKHQALAATPGCPAETFTMIQLYIQPLAACMFVLATMNRFVRVYAFLSRPRQLALQIGSGVIVVATGVRWAAIPLLDQLIYLPTGVYDEVVPNQQALLLYNLSFHGAYLVLSLADIVSLLLGLHYVLQIRSELKGLRKNDDGMVVQSTASQLVQASSSLCAASANPGSQAPPADSKQRKWVERQEQSAAVALFWILFNLALLVAYLCVMLVPEILMNLPIQFVFALLTMILKLFVTGMTFSINAMTRLVKSRNRMQS